MVEQIEGGHLLGKERRVYVGKDDEDRRVYGKTTGQFFANVKGKEIRVFKNKTDSFSEESRLLNLIAFILIK